MNVICLRIPPSQWPTNLSEISEPEGTETSVDDFSGSKTATVPSGSWSNANLEPKPAVYEYRYKYDKVGNRTDQFLFTRTGSPTLDRWIYTYNDLNQLTQRNHYTSPFSLTFDEKWLYTYDDNGNLTIAEKQNGSSVKQEKWVYSWNPRDQMTKAEKFTGTGDTYAGKVEYQYCLSCDGALSVRKEYGTGSATDPTSWRRYEYDGLNLLRIDERRDNDNDGIIESGETDWRIVEVATHAPGIVSNLLGKRVYNYAARSSSSPSSTTDFGYVHDAVGNVLTVFTDDDDEGDPTYFFHQDAFGNEVNVSPFSGSSWTSAQGAGVTEHQTGKWIDPFTQLYFFHARWYQREVGRFVARSLLERHFEHPYIISLNNPVNFADVNGLWAIPLPGTDAGQCAMDWYAGIATDPSSGTIAKIGAYLGGTLAATWTPETAWMTTCTLGGAYGCNVFGPFNPRNMGLVPKCLKKYRECFRVDRPHHGKGWHIHWPWNRPGPPGN